MTTEIQKLQNGEITLSDVQGKIISIQNKNVLLDSDVALLYGVETRDINKAVKNNPNKFPDGYFFEISNQEFKDLRGKNSTANISSKTRIPPRLLLKKVCICSPPF
jgi:hypothetical protein